MTCPGARAAHPRRSPAAISIRTCALTSAGACECPAAHSAPAAATAWYVPTHCSRIVAGSGDWPKIRGKDGAERARYEGVGLGEDGGVRLARGCASVWYDPAT